MGAVSFGEWMALGCAFIVAVTGLAIRTQSYKVPPVVMNVVRCAAATGLFWLLLPFGPSLSGLGAVQPREWALLLGSVMVGPVTGETAYLRAIREIGVSRSMALAGTYPLATLIFERLLLDVPVRPAFALGSALVVLGVVCLSTRSRRAAAEADVRPWPGVFLALSAAALWGLSTVMLKPAIAHLTAVQANSIRMPQVVLVLFLARRWTWEAVRLKALDRRALLVVAATGVLGMGVGSLMFLVAIDLVGPAKAATLTATAPVFGLAMGVGFLRERLTVRVLAGVGLCVAGVWLVL